MLFHIKTYGCQMNERESEALACLLISKGYQETASEAEADVIILNTCSVREQAERKAIGKAGLLSRLKRSRPTLITGIVGCMAQNRGESLFTLIPSLDFIAGTEQLHKVPDIIAAVAAGKRHTAELKQGEPVFHECPGHIPGKICAMTSVMRGCNQFCTYCIVPFVRGRERSRTPQSIIDEVTTLVQQGTREVLLLGQNITAYGIAEARDNGTYTPEVSPLAELLYALNDIPGLARIRFTSPHVRYMNDRFIEAICTLPKVCKAFHIPLQSASDRILNLMHRSYSADQFLNRVNAIKSKLPEVAFSTDVIVGFPTESEDDFQMTRALMNEVNFDMAYIFRYSPRTGTRSAASMPDDVPDVIKHERNQLLLADLETRALAINSRLVGRVIPVLVEGVSHRNPDKWTGRTELNKVCNFTTKDYIKPGDIARLKITATTANALSGELIDNHLV